MNLLAIDTSTELASVAVMVGEEIHSREQGSQRTHARVLLPTIDSLMVDMGIGMNQLDAIVFGCGPGSFTGLRVTCSTAKGLAYARDLPLIPVGSLDAIAMAAREQSHSPDAAVLAVLDARMQEMYWGYFTDVEMVTKARVNAVSEIQLPQVQPLLLAGVGIDLYWADFQEEVKMQVSQRCMVFPHAAAMIRLAQCAKIHSVSAAQARPVYVRHQVTGDSRG